MEFQKSSYKGTVTVLPHWPTLTTSGFLLVLWVSSFLRPSHSRNSRRPNHDHVQSEKYTAAVLCCTPEHWLCSCHVAAAKGQLHESRAFRCEERDSGVDAVQASSIPQGAVITLGSFDASEMMLSAMYLREVQVGQISRVEKACVDFDAITCPPVRILSRTLAK